MSKCEWPCGLPKGLKTSPVELHPSERSPHSWILRACRPGLIPENSPVIIGRSRTVCLISILPEASEKPRKSKTHSACSCSSALGLSFQKLSTGSTLNAIMSRGRIVETRENRKPFDYPLTPLLLRPEEASELPREAPE